ncbi:MAG: hypothetical protein MUC85_07715 [Anaerolineales bacterium]|jgi:hypothetical protein|nr:hypothetical protein [Anaerolineales bacterium]
MTKRYLIILILAASVMMSSCAVLNEAPVSFSDPNASQVHNQGTIIILQDPERIFTQSFTVPNSGLNSLTFWASCPEGSQDQELLYVSIYLPGQPTPFYSRSFSAKSIQQNTPLNLVFNPRSDPPGQAYTLELQAQSGQFDIQGRTEDIYGGGSAELDGIPLNADLAFQTTYAYTWTAFQQDLSRAWDWASQILPLFIVLILPGWFLLEITGLRRQFDGWEFIALSVGISLALSPVVMLWTTQMHLPWRSAGLWITTLLAGGGLVIILLKRRSKITLRAPDATSLVMWIIVILTCWVRVAMVRDMAAPAWVDSVHHALFGRLIAETGMYPAAFEPFFELEPTRYHPGFHASLASFMLLSGEDPAQALLSFGQVLNMLSVVSAYLFTTSLTKDKRAGAAAALAVGLFSPMPAYYTSWGRYTQLAGLLILPVPVALWRHWIEAEETNRSGWAYPVLTSLAVGGLFLVHYRVAAFAGMLLLLDWLFSLRHHKKPAIRFALQAVPPALLLIIPWLLPMITQTLIPDTQLPVKEGAVFMGDFPWGNLTAVQGKYLLWMAAAAVPHALWKRQRIAWLLPAWVGSLLILANLSAFGLPGGNLVNNVSVAITLYLPVAVLAGTLVSESIQLVAHYLPSRLLLPAKALLILTSLILGLIGSHQIVTILNQNLYLVRSADLPAISWAKENIPKGETVLVNPFLWGYNTYAGGDGGYWLSALASIPTLPPPVVHGMDRSAESAATNALSEQVIALAQHPDELYALLKSHSIHYIFLGARGGALSPDILQQSGFFEILYAEAGVSIFKTK